MRETAKWDAVSVRCQGPQGRFVTVHGRVTSAGADPHVVGEEHLFFATNAAARLRHQRRLLPASPGTLLEVEAGAVLSMELPQGCAFRTLSVAPDLLASAADGIDALRPFLARPAARARLACCLSGDLALQRLESAATSEAALRHFLEFALHAASGRVRPAERSGHAVVMRVRDYLREAFARTVTLEELGKMAGMCRFALARAFAREVGLPPHAYQTHVRVLHARELIATGTPLSKAALDVGFSDQSHLCRHFKRVLGVTPGVFARQVRSAARSTRVAA